MHRRDGGGLENGMLTGEQIKAARALVRMEVKAIAEAAGLSFDTVKRLEMFRGPISANTRTEAALRRAFRGLGVIFIDENGQGPGVRLQSPLSGPDGPLGGA